jgi:hypothetical protein
VDSSLRRVNGLKLRRRRVTPAPPNWYRKWHSTSCSRISLLLMTQRRRPTIEHYSQIQDYERFRVGEADEMDRAPLMRCTSDSVGMFQVFVLRAAAWNRSILFYWSI